MFSNTVIILYCTLTCVCKALAYSEIYGDIFPTSWDLTLYETIHNTENKCFEEKP